MPATPYAQVTVSVNSGAYQSGGITVPSLATIAFAMASTVGVYAQLWEIYSYPDGWAAPAGWTLSGGTGSSYQSNAIVPPPLTLPANTSDQWGKWMIRLTVNGNMPAGAANLVDEATAISMASSNGLVEPGWNETTQFSVLKEWLEAIQVSLKKLNDLFNGSTISTPVRWNHGLGATYAVPSGVNTSVWIDTTAGAVTAALPAAPTDGEKHTVKDTGRAVATNAIIVLANTGQKLEYSPGAVTGLAGSFNYGNGATVGLPADYAGFSATFRWGATENTWFLDAG